jgi:hypothetical protein
MPPISHSISPNHFFYLHLESVRFKTPWGVTFHLLFAQLRERIGRVGIDLEFSLTTDDVHDRRKAQLTGRERNFRVEVNYTTWWTPLAYKRATNHSINKRQLIPGDRLSRAQRFPSRRYISLVPATGRNEPLPESRRSSCWCSFGCQFVFQLRCVDLNFSPRFDVIRRRREKETKGSNTRGSKTLTTTCHARFAAVMNKTWFSRIPVGILEDLDTNSFSVPQAVVLDFE